MNKKDDGNTAVVLSNPKTIEFQVVRTSLLPGLLKTWQSNTSVGLPMKIFEISDVVLLDKSTDVGAKNVRRLAALYCPKESGSGFEMIHGLLDHIMESLDVPNEKKTGYHIEPADDSTFFPKRQANIFYKGKKIGIFGVLHPLVLESYGLKSPCSCLEIDIEPFI
jgi:phenylalanyl-tRNA synthetase beta chain